MCIMTQWFILGIQEWLTTLPPPKKKIINNILHVSCPKEKNPLDISEDREKSVTKFRVYVSEIYKIRIDG